MKLPRPNFSFPGFLRASAPTAAAKPLAKRFGGWPGRGAERWLLLIWNISGLRAVIAEGDRQHYTQIAAADSRQATFSSALADTLKQLQTRAEKIPRRTALALHHQRPGIVDLPVDPDKPRPDAQMRELLRNDLEPLLAEFGSLWTLGALLHARHYLTAADRDRVVLEESLRRQDRRTPLRYGETALELGLIDRASLNECLELQESLQFIDSELKCAWKGFADSGKKHWQACALSARQYRQCEEALEQHGLSLDTVLPLSWLSSERHTDKDFGEVQQLSLELHAEEVVAIQRQRGRIIAVTSEGRMERPLHSDWLHRLIDAWASEARAEITLYCLDPADEEEALQVSHDLELTSGHPTRLVSAAETWAGLWPALLAEASSSDPDHRLPRLVARELRGKPWKNPDFLRVGALLASLSLLLAVEGFQRLQRHQAEQKLADIAKKESDEQKRNQLTLKASVEILQIARELETTRTTLEPLINERTRLEMIASMRRYLPDLMLMLAQATGNDAVLERVGNSAGSNDATAIRVEAWSPSYTGAQDFVNRVAEQTRRLNYGVAQTEFKEERGRNQKIGYRIAFWLMQEADELEQGESLAAPAGLNPAAKGNR